MDTPIDRFNAWSAANKDYFHKKMGELAFNFNGNEYLSKQFIEEQWRLAKNWLIKNGDLQKANKRSWKRFMDNWLFEAVKQRGHILANMNYQQELAYYESKKRGHTKSDLEQIGE